MLDYSDISDARIIAGSLSFGKSAVCIVGFVVCVLSVLHIVMPRGPALSLTHVN